MKWHIPDVLAKLRAGVLALLAAALLLAILAAELGAPLPPALVSKLCELSSSKPPPPVLPD